MAKNVDQYFPKMTSSDENIHIQEAAIREFDFFYFRNDTKQLIDYQNSW